MDDHDLRHLRRCVDLAAEAVNGGDQPFGSILVSAAGEVLFEAAGVAALPNATASENARTS